MPAFFCKSYVFVVAVSPDLFEKSLLHYHSAIYKMNSYMMHCLFLTYSLQADFPCVWNRKHPLLER